MFEFYGTSSILFQFHFLSFDSFVHYCEEYTLEKKSWYSLFFFIVQWAQSRQFRHNETKISSPERTVIGNTIDTPTRVRQPPPHDTFEFVGTFIISSTKSCSLPYWYIQYQYKAVVYNRNYEYLCPPPMLLLLSNCKMKLLRCSMTDDSSLTLAADRLPQTSSNSRFVHYITFIHTVDERLP